MDRVASIVKTAAQLTRQIWASLPFRVRVAEFLTRLASRNTDAFGNAIYALFIQHGIEDMPDVNGKTPQEFALGIPKNRLADRLPSNYGRNFGDKAYKILLGKHGNNPAKVEDIMSSFLLAFMTGGADHLKPGTTRSLAESYVLRGLINRGLNVVRKEHATPEVSDVVEEEDGEWKRNEGVSNGKDLASDEEALEQLLHRPDVKRGLSHIHPDAELYVRLSLLEGHKDRAIIGDPAAGKSSMLPHPVTKQGLPMTYGNWSAQIKPKIHDFLKSVASDEFSALG